MTASIFGGEINRNQSQQACQVFTCFRIDPSNLPKKEFDLHMTGSQEVLLWYEPTIMSLQFFINLIHRKNFRIQVNLAKVHREYPMSFC